MNERTCASCRFSSVEDSGDGELIVECRRHPRQVVVLEDDDIASVFPAVELDDWCAEFEDVLPPWVETGEE